MTLSIKNDQTRAGGGYALLEGPALAGVTAISIENCASGQYLGEDGRWKKAPFAFPVEANASGALSLGPRIVDHVPTELLVALRTEDGTELGKLFWSDVLPSRNRDTATKTEVYEERRRSDAEAAEAGRRKAAEEEAARRAADDAARKKAADDLAAQQAADDAARRAADDAERDAARRKAEQEEAARRAAATAAAAKTGEDDRQRSSRGPWIAVAAVLLLAGTGAAIAFAFGVFKPRPAPVAERTMPARTQDAPARAEVTAPRAPVETPVDCDTYSSRLDALSSMADPAKVRLGNEALQSGCGAAAFKAFNDSDWQNDEDAAWNLARFYDPNESRPVYRSVATIHPDWAAAYYHEWRGRSARQAAALAKICASANSGAASLQRACSR